MKPGHQIRLIFNRISVFLYSIKLFTSKASDKCSDRFQKQHFKTHGTKAIFKLHKNIHCDFGCNQKDAVPENSMCTLQGVNVYLKLRN